MENSFLDKRIEWRRMAENRKQLDRRSWRNVLLMFLASVAVVVGTLLVTYQPDRPVAMIVPGSSPGPAFVVQIIRPRLGLPLGGLLPPGLFGVDGQLGFDSTSDGVSIGRVELRRIELSADGWSLVLVRDADGQVSLETEIIFDLIFEDQVRRVQCRPADPAVGSFTVVTLDESRELAGSFDIELARCVDGDTGKPLGWPPSPLVLRGSFDRLPLDATSQ